MGDLAAGLRVQVCYVRPGVAILRDVSMPAGATLHDAIMQSGIINDVPEIDLTVCRVGIYGKLKELDTVVRDHDRVEIYRPLMADPKDSRRKRVKRDAAKPVKS